MEMRPLADGSPRAPQDTDNNWRRLSSRDCSALPEDEFSRRRGAGETFPSLTAVYSISKQIAGKDEDQEAVTRTRLIVDDFFRHLNSEDVNDQEATNVRKETAQFQQQSGLRIPKSKLPPASSDNHWIFGSVLRSGDSRSYEDLHAAGDPVYYSFDPRLRDFLHNEFPREYLTAEDRIEVSSTVI
jgi:hypothetical protein